MYTIAYADPLLAAHKVLPRLYLLGTRDIEPVSVRDQMIRGQLLVERLIQHGLILPDVEDKPLVIVGAGACGVSAAITAASKNIHVQLIEKRDGPFHLQLQTTTRWLDPSQYDWPADFWNTGLYPKVVVPDANVALPWSSNYSHLVAMHWIRRYNNARLDYADFFHCRFNTEVTGLDPVYDSSGSSVEGVNVLTSHGVIASASAVLWAAGLGSEDATIKVTSGGVTTEIGTGFWETDDLQQANHEAIAILGAGDGALQEVLRVATGRNSAAEIMADLEKISSGVKTRLESIRVKLRMIEGRAARHWGWESAGYHGHDRHLFLQQQHEGLINELLDFMSREKSLPKLKQLLKPDLETSLIYRCTHFTCFYPLNRFLVLLLAMGTDHLIHLEANRKFLRCEPAPGVGSYNLALEECPSCCSLMDNPASMTLPGFHRVIKRFGLNSDHARPPVAPGYGRPPVYLDRGKHLLPCGPKCY